MLFISFNVVDFGIITCQLRYKRRVFEGAQHVLPPPQCNITTPRCVNVPQQWVIMPQQWGIVPPL